MNPLVLAALGAGVGFGAYQIKKKMSQKLSAAESGATILAGVMRPGGPTVNYFAPKVDEAIAKLINSSVVQSVVPITDSSGKTLGMVIHLKNTNSLPTGKDAAFLIPSLLDGKLANPMRSVADIAVITPVLNGVTTEFAILVSTLERSEETARVPGIALLGGLDGTKSPYGLFRATPAPKVATASVPGGSADWYASPAPPQVSGYLYHGGV